MSVVPSRRCYDRAPAINCDVARMRVSIFEVNKPDLDLPPVSTAIPLLSCNLSSCSECIQDDDPCAWIVHNNERIYLSFETKYLNFSAPIIMQKCDEKDIKKKKGIVCVRERNFHYLFLYQSFFLQLYKLITKTLNIKIGNLRYDDSIFSKGIFVKIVRGFISQ